MGKRNLAEMRAYETVKLFERGSVYGFPRTNGSLCSNYVAWVRNNHPILSAFFADPIHPFSKKKRGIVFYCYFAWAMFITGILKYFTYGGAHMHWLLLSIIISVLTVPYSMMLVMLSTCGRCTADFEKKYPSISECLNGSGTLVLYFMSIVSIILIAFGIFFFVQEGADSLGSWIIGVMESWVTWFFMWSPLFFWRYRADKQAFSDSFPGIKSVDHILTKEEREAIAMEEAKNQAGAAPKRFQRLLMLKNGAVESHKRISKNINSRLKRSTNSRENSTTSRSPVEGKASTPSNVTDSGGKLKLSFSSVLKSKKNASSNQTINAPERGRTTYLV